MSNKIMAQNGRKEQKERAKTTTKQKGNFRENPDHTQEKRERRQGRNLLS